MRYGAGKLGAGEGMALVTMLLLPNIYLSEPSLLIGFVGGSAWLLKILGGVLAALILLAALKLYESHAKRYHGGKMISFYTFVKEVLGAKGAVCYFAAWAAVFEIQSILTLREFADHTLISALSASSLPLILVLFTVCITIVLRQGMEVILRAAYIFFAIAAVGILFSLFALYNAYDIDNLFPWRGYGFMRLAEYSFRDLGAWTLAFSVLFLAPNLQDIRTIRKSIYYGFGFTIALKAILIAAIIMIFGVVIAPERALLFYEIVQSINLSQYLQRVDAIFIMIWLTGGLVSAFLMQYFVLGLLAETFNLKDMKPLIPLVTLISATFALLPNSVAAVIELNSIFSFAVSSAFLALNFIVLTIAYFVKCRRKKPCVGAIE